MSERKAVIKNADMSEDMQQDAVDCASQALEKYNIEKVCSVRALHPHPFPCIFLLLFREYLLFSCIISHFCDKNSIAFIIIITLQS